jgi:hypothetical protein
MPKLRRSSWRAALLLPLAVAALVSCSPTKTRYAPNGVGAGAYPIGSTSYAVPGDAKFVSTSGNDNADGSSSSPWRTLDKAVHTVPSGSTVVMRGGTYNEQVIVPAERRVTIQPYPGEAVWMSGSQLVSGWVADGGDWRKDGWTARFNHDNLPTPLVDPHFPMAGHPDQAWIDGRRLDQVGSRAEVRPGTFFVDEGASQLWIGDNPTNHSVEATVLAEGLEVRSAGSVVRGIGFKNYGNPIGRLGSVKLAGNDIVFEHNLVKGAATSGLTVLGDNVQVKRNTIVENGQLGIQVDQASGLLVEGNTISWNNTEEFITSSAAGGIKLTKTLNTVVRDNIVEANGGHGVWFDSNSNGATMVHNITRYNDSAGLFFEHSENAVIAGNTSTNNEAGIQAGESSTVEVWNNTLVANVYAFKAYKGPRVDWPTHFVFRNNVVSGANASHLPLLDNDDTTGQMTWTDMGWDSDFNAFYRPSSTRTEFFLVLANGADRLHYKSLQEVQDETPLESNSIYADNVGQDPYVNNIFKADYRLPESSPAKGRGQALPGNIATLLGVQAGVPVDMGAI